MPSEAAARTRNQPREERITVAISLAFSLVCYSAEGKMIGKQMLHQSSHYADIV